ncbi:PREDICTED: uncharacterized protein LOC104765347 [Camelina sativa]|uniref:Uncharacterized protein LOC104765347 n=1 Tax=Camelina sativa TaxID=90675 RepID=A0ABM0XKL1_CAMSA|nr:PREDICTED: uncharacterized protein LOC104765347 [Camelina sativa]
MGIDAKDVGTLLWKILIFSTNTIYTYVTKYPFVSVVSAVIFLLYVFLPRLFYFMLYSSPLIACSAFYLRNHPSFKLLNLNTDDDDLSSNSQKRSSEEETRKADLKHQRSVRRNARRKVEEVGKDWDSSQASEDERDKVILTTLYGEIPNATKSPRLQKLKKDRSFLVSEDFSFESSLDEECPSATGDVSVVDPSERLTSGGGETEIECSSDDEEETSREDKKVVAWTEDDQKNLMELGNSEMERNKRLEHLITRRRMRRVVKVAAEGRSLMDMEVPPVCVGRNYFGLDQDNYIVDGLQMPESAPSVLLLPTKNPFDLPYDPQEEKPNLSGDSFQQEFAANPNDIFFCRHESFCRRVFPLENQLDSKWEPWRNKSIDGWPRTQQGSNDGLVGEKHSLVKGKDLTRAEGNDMESEHSTEIVMSDSSSLLSPGEREMDSDVSIQADSSGASGKRNGDLLRVENPLVGLVPRNTGSLSSSLAAERQRYMEHFGYSSRKGRKLSVESDLQVEFSEIGSPPTTVDGNNSSDEEKSLFVYESDTGKEISGEENEMIQKKRIVDRTAESQLLPMGKVDQDFNETSSISSPENHVAKHFEGLSDGTNVNGRSEDSERGLHISEEAKVTHINEVISKLEEDSQELLQNSTDEMKISNDSGEPEPSERRTNQESEERIEGGQSTQEMMQENVEPQVSIVTNVTSSDESATSPRSVLPDMVLPLEQTYTLTSESLEHTSASQPEPVIPYSESPQNQSGGDIVTVLETEGQSEARIEEATGVESSSDAIVSLFNTQQTQASAV